jgi:hypothetical protein
VGLLPPAAVPRDVSMPVARSSARIEIVLDEPPT